MIRDATRGNVSIEFIAISIFLLIPICYITVSALAVAQTFLTITGAARTGARVFVTQETDTAAHIKGLQTARRQLEIGQINNAEFSVNFSCTEKPCLTSNGYVTATIKGSKSIALPLINPVKVALVSSQTMEVDAFR